MQKCGVLHFVGIQRIACRAISASIKLLVLVDYSVDTVVYFAIELCNLSIHYQFLWPLYDMESPT